MMNEALEKYENNPEESVVLASTGTLSRWQLRKHAKTMVERNALPPQRESVVSEDGLYLPPFHTEEAYEIEKAHNSNSMNLHVFKVIGFLVGGLGVISTPLVLADSRSGPFEIITISLVASFTLLPLPVWLSRSKAYKQLSHNMKSAAFDPFASWAKEHYGIEVSRDEDLSSYITTGADEAYLHYVTDSLTGDRYRVNQKDNGEIFLSAATGEQLAEATASNQKQLTSKVSESEQQVLPDDAAALYNHLMSSVALLMKQELNVEETHAVKRTEQAVSALVKQYHHAVSLAPSEALHSDLVEFFQTQIVFLDGLKQEHANRIVKRMAVEMTAVKEATVVKDVQLTIPQ
jgi:hypothetical protein